MAAAPTQAQTGRGGGAGGGGGRDVVAFATGCRLGVVHGGLEFSESVVVVAGGGSGVLGVVEETGVRGWGWTGCVEGSFGEYASSGVELVKGFV